MDIKEILQKTIDEAKKKKSEEDSARKEKNDADRMAILHGVGKDLADSLKPILPELAKSAQISEETIRKALSEAIQINMPELEMPEMDFSRLEAVATRIEEAVANLNLKEPIVNVPAPVVNIPKTDPFPSKIDVGLGEYSNTRPMPVMMMDLKGRPLQFPVGGGNSGGKANYLTISDIRTSAGASIIDQVEGALKVAGSFSVTASNSSTHIIDASNNIVGSVANPLNVAFTGGAGTSATNIIDSSGVAYSGSNPLPVTFTGAAGTSVSLVNSDGSYYNGDNPLPVTFSAASVQPVSQVSGASWSIQATDIFSTIVASVVVNSDNRVRVELPATTLTGITNSLAMVNLHRDGNPWQPYAYDNGDSASAIRVTLAGNASASVAATQSGTWNVGTVTSITNTLAANVVDSSGIAYSGSNPVPITIISGAPATTVALLTRQTNPTAIASDYVPQGADDLGRGIIRPIQVRDLIQTAYVQLTTGTETTLRAAVAGAFLDLIYVMASNNSDVAVSVDLRAVTAGNVMMTIQVPASGTAGVSLPVPLPQSEQGNNWTADMGDITGTTVSLSALFSQEV